jgi:two-component system NtrC family sensor kinase
MLPEPVTIERRLPEEAPRLAKLAALTVALAPQTDLARAVASAASHVKALLPGARGYIVICQGVPSRIVAHAPFGAPAPAHLPTDATQSNSLCALVLADSTMRLVRDITQAGLAAWERLLAGSEARSLLVAPIEAGGELRGALLLAPTPGTPVLDDDLRLVLAAAAAIGVTVERIRNHTALARSEARARGILQQLGVPLLVVDPASGRVVEANGAAEALFGYPVGDLVGCELDELLDELPVRGPAPIARRLLTALNGVTRRSMESLARTSDGEQVPVLLDLCRLSGGGSPLLITLRDISERQREARSLAQDEKLAAMGRLTAAIAHEINNPLQAVSNSLHLLLSRDLSDEKRQRYLGMAQKEVEQMIGVVRRMLDFYRPSRAGRHPVAMNAVIEGALAVVAGPLAERGVMVERDLAPTLPYVSGVGGHLREAIYKLLLNGADAMPSGGRLMIRSEVEHRTADESQQVVITLRDGGARIPEDELHAIFEPFSRTRRDGTGIGLPVCYSIIEQHGGHLTLTSDDGGTTFRIALPAMEG